MERTDRHLVKYDVQVVRDYHPYYFVGGGRYDPTPNPPVTVHLSADFDNGEAADTFGAKVRELLEQL